MAKRLTTETFIQRSHAAHSDQYDYQLVEFTTTKNHVSIICPVHGIFESRPDHHMAGQGCPTCAKEKRLGGYCEELFAKKPELKDLPGYLYFIRFESDSETFYKVGITSRTIEDRFKKKGDKSHYEIDIIGSRAGTLYEVYKLEQEILFLYKLYQYTPEKWFSGWTECLFFENEWEMKTLAMDYYDPISYKKWLHESRQQILSMYSQ